MTDCTQLTEQVIALLEKECTLAQELLAALKEEHDTLVQCRTSLPESLQKVQEALLALEQLDQKSGQLLMAVGLPPGKQGIEAIFHHCKTPTEKLAEIWQTLLTLLAQCHEQNQLNGGIVELSQRHIQQALNVIKGPQSTLAYGPAGKTIHAMRGRMLAKV